MQLTVEQHVAVDPGAGFGGQVGGEVELALFGEAVGVAGHEPVDEGTAECDQSLDVGRLCALMEQQPCFGRALCESCELRRTVFARPVCGQVDDGVDLRAADAVGLEQIVDGAVTREVDARVVDAARSSGEESVEGIRRRAGSDGEDAADPVVVVHRLDKPPSDRRIGVRDEDIAFHGDAGSGSF